jgi:transcriptional regulator with XRE-family HTH domain
MISIEAKEKISALGSRIRELRLIRNEPQERFAARLGVSVPTLRKMENGSETVMLGIWAEALYIAGRLDDLDAVLANKPDLFKIRDMAKIPKRQRASKRE